MNYAVIRKVLEARIALSESATSDAREDRGAAEAEEQATAEAAIDSQYDAAKRSQIAGVIAAGVGVVVAGASFAASVPSASPTASPGGPGHDLMDAVTKTPEPGGADAASWVQLGGAAVTAGASIALAPSGAAAEANTDAQIAKQEAELMRAEVQASEAARAQSEDRLRNILLNRPSFA